MLAEVYWTLMVMTMINHYCSLMMTEMMSIVCDFDAVDDDSVVLALHCVVCWLALLPSNHCVVPNDCDDDYDGCSLVIFDLLLDYCCCCWMMMMKQDCCWCWCSVERSSCHVLRF